MAHTESSLRSFLAREYRAHTTTRSLGLLAKHRYLNSMVADRLEIEIEDFGQLITLSPALTGSVRQGDVWPPLH